MSSPRAIGIRKGPAITAFAFVLLLPWAVAGAEQAGPYSETKLLANDGDALDQLGYTVAVSGDTALIGASSPDELGVGLLSGSAYVFDRDPLDPTVWTQTAELTPDNGAPDDNFGYSVAVSGDTALIGAYSDAAFGPFSGAAYVFDRDRVDRTLWTQTAKLIAPDGATFDAFGFSVAIHGDTALIGAYHDSDLGSESGSAYLFERDPLDQTVWTQTAKLTAADGAPADFFGAFVALGSNLALIGAVHDDDHGISSGSVYVFERDPLDRTAWTQTAKLTPDDGAAGDRFGSSLAISGGTAVIGAALDDDLGFDLGSAYAFERDPVDPTVWTQRAKLTAADGAPGDTFGISVGVSGETAVIGALFNENLGVATGSAYVFQRDPVDPAVWIQTTKLTAADGAELDFFGRSVAIAGGSVVVGAFGGDDLGYDSGAAYVYSLEGLLRLAVSGSCPGSVSIQVTGATPGGRVAMIASPSLGLFRLPGGPCAGTDLDLANPKLLGVFIADGDGEVSRTMQPPPAACGANLQALDVSSCGTTNVEQVP